MFHRLINNIITAADTLKKHRNHLPVLTAFTHKNKPIVSPKTTRFSYAGRRPPSNFWRRLALLGVIGGIGGVVYAEKKNGLSKEGMLSLWEKMHFLKAENKTILTIPGLAHSAKIVHGVTTTETGNVGFITLKDGVTPSQLSASIEHVLSDIHVFAQTSQRDVKEPLLILNETIYANAKTPNLPKTADNKPLFIPVITAENIAEFIEGNQFPLEGDFASLRDKCVKVLADGFVSNVSKYKGKQLYFAANTADAAPIILFDDVNGVIGVMPCPWHAVCKGQVDELIAKMISLGANPHQIHLGVGPGLGPNNYEFSKKDTPNFYQPGVIDARDGVPFQGRPEFENFIKPHPADAAKCLLNLPGMLQTIALAKGIPAHQIANSGWDSMTDTRFYSARRTTPAADQANAAKNKYPKTARGATFVGFFGKKSAPVVSLSDQMYAYRPGLVP